MPRYYVSFSFQTSRGLGIASLDVTTTRPITDVADLDPVYGQIAQQGYTNVKILAFSLYTDPAPAAARPQTPNRTTDRPAYGKTRRRPPRPGRSS